ncbi:MAG: hypothetical protein HY869_10710 [Chloroflexi bacterium]|nr:hypothetical protein [Chloroflexota bacterium]
MKTQSNFNFWQRWLIVVSAGVMLYGISMVLAPDLLRQFLSLLAFGSPSTISSFGTEAAHYIALAHAVMGSVMFGWGATMMFILFSQFRPGNRTAWLSIAVPLAAWFIPDTLYSLWSGFWQNTVLNLVFAILFAIPLAATFRTKEE